MQPSDRNDFAELLKQTSEYYDRKFTPTVVAMYWNGLQDVPMSVFRGALNAHMNDPQCGQFMPKIADIRRAIAAAAVNDGRPGAEEAWAMVPRDEMWTVVWTTEMAAAWGIAQVLLQDGDKIAARMAFKEAYTKAVDQSRAAGQPVKWTASLGFDPDERAGVLARAVESGKLPLDYVSRIAPLIAESEAGRKLIERAKAALSIGATA
jgi:hypothetical protein